MIGKGQPEPTLVISTRSDAELNSNLRRRAGLMILAGGTRSRAYGSIRSVSLIFEWILVAI